MFNWNVEEIVNLWHTLLSQTETKGNKLREASQQQQFNRSIEDVEGWLYEIEGQLKSEAVSAKGDNLAVLYYFRAFKTCPNKRFNIW
jgi:hypothetical protein